MCSGEGHSPAHVTIMFNSNDTDGFDSLTIFFCLLGLFCVSVVVLINLMNGLSYKTAVFCFVCIPGL